MKNMLVQSIKQLKQQQEMNKKNPEQNKETEKTTEHKSPPKRNAPDFELTHREKQSRDKSIFTGYTFCFPIVDREITPKQIELLSESIAIEGGEVIEFKLMPVKQEIDFLLINPAMKPQVVNNKVEGKLKYKQMLDYHFVTDCLREGTLKNFEKYSLFINIGQLWNAEHQNSGHKKIKRESNNDTVKLSDEEQENRTYIKPERHEPEMKEDEGQHWHRQKEEMQEVMLTHKNIGGNNFSMNQFIADELKKLMEIYANQRDIGRKIAYMKAAAVIRNLDKEIQSQRDVENIKGIGKKISDKIKELLNTGTISKLQKLQSSEKNIVLGQLSQVWGIGPSKANQLYSMGIKTLDQLRKRTDLLTKNQKLGLKYHEQLQTKIPRQKVTKMFQFVKNVIATLVPSLDLYRLEVCGSYRRGKATCGDMDIIISRKDGTYEKNLLIDIVRQLENVGFLTDHLTSPKPSDARSSISYMGVCQFEGPTHHRIDIKYYPIEQYAYAILYFTGSGMFNRMMRLHCMKLGLNLSDHGATPKMEKGVIWSKPIPTCYTQQDIFKFLGLDYKTPKEREM